MVDMDADWRLPPPINISKGSRRSFGSIPMDAVSVSGSFSSLAAPVAAEAVRRARELATGCDAEGFHQLRVAFRKLRALYWAYSPYLGEEATAQANEEFKRLAAVAGGSREWDIASDLLKAAQASRASMGLLITAAQKKRAQAVGHCQAMINSDEVEAFLEDVLRRAQERLESTCNEVSVQAFAEDRVRRAKRALRKRSQHATRQDPVEEEDLHDVRKAGKKLRYLLEFFQPIIEGSHDRTIKELTSVQNKLGQFNDIAASENLIRDASFDDVPVEVVQESLQWLDKQKRQRMEAALRRVRAMAG
jgi:CHAD domain-containing protein